MRKVKKVGGSDQSEEELEEGNAEEAGEAGPRYNWRLDTVKGRMHAAGRDKRHSFDHKLFKGFLEKLGHILKAGCARVNEKRVKKSTANYCTYIACYLYYLDSSKVDLTKMLDKRDLQSYITLLMNYVTFATLKNIIAAFIRFVLYVRNNTGFGHTKQMNALDNALADHLKIANRGVSNERNLKQLERRQGVGEVPLKECMKQLNALLPKLKSIMKMDKEMITRGHGRYFFRVLQAILQIRHAQRPGVGTGMTVGEWNARSTVQEHTVPFVLEHKTSAGCPVKMCHDQEEYKQLEFYMRKIRPMYSSDLSPNAPFSVNERGGLLDQTTKDLGRLGMTVNNNKARKAYQTQAASLDLVATHINSINLYLHHSKHIASVYYRNR